MDNECKEMLLAIQKDIAQIKADICKLSGCNSVPEYTQSQVEQIVERCRSEAFKRNSFVKRLLSIYDTCGSLTDKQLAALDKAKPDKIHIPGAEWMGNGGDRWMGCGQRDCV